MGMLRSLAAFLVVMTDGAFAQSTYRGQELSANLDGDGIPDRVFVQVEPEAKTETVIVRFGNGDTAYLMAVGYRTRPLIRLEIRASGDQRCRNYRPRRTCGRTHTIHNGPAVTVRMRNQLPLHFFWTTGTHFLVEPTYPD